MCIFEILDSFLGMEIKKMKHLQVSMSDHHNAVDFFTVKAGVLCKSYLFAGGKNGLGDLLLATAVKRTAFFLMEVLDIQVSSLRKMRGC